VFRWVARETAQELGYPYPDSSDAQITAWTKEYLAAVSVERAD
jgi:hypothetical protein